VESNTFTYLLTYLFTYLLTHLSTYLLNLSHHYDGDVDVIFSCVLHIKYLISLRAAIAQTIALQKPARFLQHLFYIILWQTPLLCDKRCNWFHCSMYYILLHMKPHCSDFYAIWPSKCNRKILTNRTSRKFTL